MTDILVCFGREKNPLYFKMSSGIKNNNNKNNAVLLFCCCTMAHYVPQTCLFFLKKKCDKYPLKLSQYFNKYHWNRCTTVVPFSLVYLLRHISPPLVYFILYLIVCILSTISKNECLLEYKETIYLFYHASKLVYINRFLLL